MSRAPSVVVVGESIMDVVVGPGSDSEFPGGSPANVALGLARLGVDTEFVTRLGADDRGASIAGHLAQSGVRLFPLPAVERTSTAVATLSPDGSASYGFDIRWELPAGLEIGAPTVIHTGSIASFLEPGAVEVLRLLSSRPESTIATYDPNIRPGIIGEPEDERPFFDAVAQLCNVVKLSAEDAEWLFPGLATADVLEHIVALGPSLAVLTDGGEGSQLATGRDRVTVPPIRVEVVDTIGAGDTYMASLIDSLLGRDVRTLTADALAAIGRRAAAAAALCVSKAGAQPPTRVELERFLAASS